MIWPDHILALVFHEVSISTFLGLRAETSIYVTANKDAHIDIQILMVKSVLTWILATASSHLLIDNCQQLFYTIYDST